MHGQAAVDLVLLLGLSLAVCTMQDIAFSPTSCFIQLAKDNANLRDMDTDPGTK